MVKYALKVFEHIRQSSRCPRPLLRAALEGSGFAVGDVVTALTRAKLLVAKRGPQGGYFYPTK